MSRNRNKRGRYVPDQTRRAEVLSTRVNPTGAGEDGVVKAILSPEFVDMSSVEATNLALMFQKLLEGQNAIISRQDEFSDYLNRLTERMNKFDKAAIAWENDREKMLSEVMDYADKLRIPDSQRQQFEAKGVAQYQQVLQAKIKDVAADQRSFDERIAAEPKIGITSPGKIIYVATQGGSVPKLEPEVIRIKHRTWVLTPGVETFVPQSVYTAYMNMKRTQAEGAERKAVLDVSKGISQDVEVARKMQEIDRKYNSPSEHFQIAS